LPRVYRNSADALSRASNGHRLPDDIDTKRAIAGATCERIDEAERQKCREAQRLAPKTPPRRRKKS
jgi:hypothetical protein